MHWELVFLCYKNRNSYVKILLLQIVNLKTYGHKQETKFHTKNHRSYYRPSISAA